MDRRVAIALVLAGAVLSPAQQRPRQRSGNVTMGAPPLKGVIISERGKLKEITKRKIVIQSADNQLMSIRRNSKTRFMRGESDIKPFEIDLESMVVIDVTEDTDLKLLAITVRADPAVKRAPLGSR